MLTADDPKALGHSFADRTLLLRALTHRSAAADNNERLEFLGDALVNMLVAELIHEHQPPLAEGEMTSIRSALVSGAALAHMARDQALGDRLQLGAGEEKTGGRERNSILADSFEAIVAAIYLDAGWPACRAAVRKLFAPALARQQRAGSAKDAKSALQELMQAHGLPRPVYALLECTGHDHARVFTVACRAGDPLQQASGHGSNRRAAEQIAAGKVLAALQEPRVDD